LPVFGAVSAFDAAGLVVAGGVQDEIADELSGVAVQDTDVAVVNEHRDIVLRSLREGMQVTLTGDFNPWVELFARAVEVQAREGLKKIR
jgi:cytochrome c-type biogenesis protein CcmE